MFGLFDVLLILVLEFDIPLDLVLDELMLICEGTFQQVDVSLFLVKVVVDTCILVLVVPQSFLQMCVFF